MTEAEMRQYIMDHMARHKVPRYIAFTDSFPMNAAGKMESIGTVKGRIQVMERLVKYVEECGGRASMCSALKFW
jgi:fatty-acyl-CoA synthase